MDLTGKYMPGEWRTKKTWKECPQNPWKTWTNQGLQPQACNAVTSFPGSLIFNTTTAALRLEHDSRDIYKDASQTDRDFAICNLDGERVGWLNKMSHDWIDLHAGNGKTYDFIVLCGALANWRSRKTLVQVAGDFDLWRLHVMLVERLPLESFVARRIDVGIIDAHKWKYCNPRWETIVLC